MGTAGVVRGDAFQAGRKLPRPRWLWLAVSMTLLAIGALPCHAQAPPKLTVIGLGGGVSCAEWVAVGASDPGLEQWTFGYLSAMAATVQLRTGADPLGNMDSEAIHAWLGAYCREHYEEPLTVALVRMVFARQR
jgi:hypothetical protein